MSGTPIFNQLCQEFVDAGDMDFPPDPHPAIPDQEQGERGADDRRAEAAAEPVSDPEPQGTVEVDPGAAEDQAAGRTPERVA